MIKGGPKTNEKFEAYIRAIINIQQFSSVLLTCTIPITSQFYSHYTCYNYILLTTTGLLIININNTNINRTLIKGSYPKREQYGTLLKNVG